MKCFLAVAVSTLVFIVPLTGCEVSGAGANEPDQTLDPDIKGPAIVQGGQTGSVGPSPAAFWTLGELTPTDGETGVPRDAPIMVRGEPHSEAACFGNDFSVHIRVTVREAGSGAEVEGVLGDWLNGMGVGGSDTATDPRMAQWPIGDFFAAWRPTDPLKPGTEYSVEIEAHNTQYLDSAGGVVPEVQGPRALQASFTTSDAMLPTLALAAEPAVEYFSYQAELIECGPGECSDCRLTGATRQAVFARIRFGALSGGWDAHPYSAVLFLTDDTPNLYSDPGDDHYPHEVTSGERVWIEAGSGFDMSLIIPEEDWVYTPCFAFQLEDASGQTVEPEPICADVPAWTVGH